MRKLVESHPEVELAPIRCIADSIHASASSQATAPPAKKSKKGYPATVKHNILYKLTQWQLIFVDPSGYDKVDPLVLDGLNACQYCHLSPCVTSRPPSWLRGSAEASLSNISKRFKLYRKFWMLLGQLGVWNHPEYIAHKQTKTSVLDHRDVMPDCVLRVNIHIYVTLHEKTRHIVLKMIFELRRPLPIATFELVFQQI